MLLKILSALVLCSCMAAALAQPAAVVAYRVEVQAPAPFANMLREGLNIVRWQQDPDMTGDLLERLLDEAVREAREAVATEGYFSAEIAGAIDRSRSPWVVSITVEPGPRTLVESVELRFSGPATEDEGAREAIERARSTWMLRRGEPFRQRAWDEAKEQAVRELSAWKYAAAAVQQSQALIDPKAATAALSVEIASGPPFSFGPVEVVGARRYPDRVVRNLSPMSPGDIYERERLLVYQRRLLETGYFVSAQVAAEPEAALGGSVPVRVAVIEGQSQHVEAGIGYSTDRGARFELRYNDVDVRDSAWRFRSALQADQKVQRLTLDLDSPPRSDGSWNNTFIRARQADIQNESLTEYAVGMHHNWGLERTPTSFILSAHHETQRFATNVADRSHALYFGYRLPFRKTDDPVSPRSGWFGSIEVGGAPEWLSSRTFTRALGSLSLLVPLGRRDDLLLRSQLGIVLSGGRDGIPPSFLFRTGGDQTVRGYAFESIGVTEGEAVVGGRYLALGSVEYTHWFGEGWGLAAFMDAGNAWDDRNRLSLARGYGVGGRFRTPIGPIRADLAFGERTRDVRLHFSVGFTF